MNKVFLTFAGYFYALSVVLAQSITPTLIANCGLNSDQQNFHSSMGEPLVNLIVANNLSITSGFHQGSVTITNVSDELLELDVFIFPNPTPDLINIKTEIPGTYSYELLDIKGRLLRQDAFFETCQINLSDLLSGQYFLKLSSTQFSKVYKIIKTN